jgi:hypothetical protein
MVAHLLASTPVYSPPQQETVTVDDQDYLVKPIIVATAVTPAPLRVYASNDGVTRIDGYNPGTCVLYAQKRGLRLKGFGAAKNYPTNASEPVIGGFVKTSESKLGHIAYVAGIDGDSIIIQESNYREYLTQRTLKINDPRIVGYIVN